MSTGKCAAQASHAAVEAFQISKPNLTAEWYKGLHYTKLVMLAEDTEQLKNIAHYLEERGFVVKLIVDEGRTEVKPYSATALGVEIVDRDDPHTLATFGDFRTYKDKKKQPPKKWWQKGR